MSQFIMYFIAGGTLATLVAYFASRGNPLLAALVSSIPVKFLLNISIVYRTGGIYSSLAYSKNVLLILPVFVIFVIITMRLLPQVGMPKALVLGMMVYPALTLISQVKKRGLLKRIDNNDKDKNNKGKEEITNEG